MLLLMLIAIYLQYKCFLFTLRTVLKSTEFFRGGGRVCVCVEVSLRTACCCQKCSNLSTDKVLEFDMMNMVKQENFEMKFSKYFYEKLQDE